MAPPGRAMPTAVAMAWSVPTHSRTECAPKPPVSSITRATASSPRSLTTSVPPNSFASVIRSACRPMMMICSPPSRLAARTPQRPTAPSPTTATRLPGPTLAVTAAWWPVPITSDSVRSEGIRASSALTGRTNSVPSAWGMRSASAWAPSMSPPLPKKLTWMQEVGSPSWQKAQVPSDEANGITTRSPPFAVRTSGPTASTMPIASWPMRCPPGAGPRLYGQRSLPQMQARVTRTTASVGWTIVASGTFSTRTSPALCMTVARMAVLPVPVIRFPADVFGDGSCGVTQPVGWASACGRRTRGGGGGALERGGAGGAVPRRGGRPLGPARPGDLAAGEGSRGGRGGRDDRVRGAVGREAAGAVQRRGSGRARRPATGQRDEADDPEAGAARQAAGPPGGAAARRRAVEQPQGRGVDGGGARAGRGGGPARLGGAAGGRSRCRGRSIRRGPRRKSGRRLKKARHRPRRGGRAASGQDRRSLRHGGAPHRAEADPPPRLGAQGRATARARPSPLRVALRDRLRAADLGRGLLVLGERGVEAVLRGAPRPLRPRSRGRSRPDHHPRPRQRRLAHGARAGRPRGHPARPPAALQPRAPAGRMPLAGGRRAARRQALPHDPGPRPCGRRALRHPRRRAGPLQGKGRLPLVAEADHVGLITRMWYETLFDLSIPMFSRDDRITSQ